MTTNLRKFGRDLAITLALAALLWLSDNLAEIGPAIGLPEAATLLGVSLASLVYRSARTALGKGPESA